MPRRLPNDPCVGTERTERQPGKHRKPEICVVVDDQFEFYWSLSLHNDIVQIRLIISQIS